MGKCLACAIVHGRRYDDGRRVAWFWKACTTTFFYKNYTKYMQGLDVHKTRYLTRLWKLAWVVGDFHDHHLGLEDSPIGLYPSLLLRFEQVMIHTAAWTSRIHDVFKSNYLSRLFRMLAQIAGFSYRQRIELSYANSAIVKVRLSIFS
jgi:hypothetical protein